MTGPPLPARVLQDTCNAMISREGQRERGEDTRVTSISFATFCSVMGRPSSCKMRVAYVHARVFSSSCQHALSSPSNRTTVPTTPQARDCCQFQHPQRNTQRRHPTARGESCAWRGSARAGHHAPRAERCQSRATTFASGPRQHDCHNPGAFHRAATRTQARKRSAATTDSPSLASSTCSWGM